MSKHRKAGGYGAPSLEQLKTALADQAELLGILARENRELGRMARHLVKENRELFRLCELQQRRIDGFEAEAWSLREVV